MSPEAETIAGRPASSRSLASTRFTDAIPDLRSDGAPGAATARAAGPVVACVADAVQGPRPYRQGRPDDVPAGARAHLRGSGGRDGGARFRAVTRAMVGRAGAG